MRFAVIIPARYESTRLPGKPLVEICGKPMILHTYDQCEKAVPRESIYVATDDARIVDVCNQAGIQVLLTSSTCLTGTDRVAEAAGQVVAGVYINVQGDEPVFNPADLKKLIAATDRHPGEVLNGYCPIQDEAQFRNASAPKVVATPDGALLYMSRAPIPTDKRGSFAQAWRQVCAYAFPPEALREFASAPAKTPLEAIEDIEILRFLELGWRVRMIPLSDQSIPVDHPSDIPRAEAAIKARSSA